jgi:PAS domain S-box-containing protein
MKSPSSESSDHQTSDIESSLLSQAQSIVLRESEKILEGLASVFLSADPDLLQRAIEILERPGQFKLLTPESPGLEARYKILVEQIPAIVFLGFLDQGAGEAYVSPQIEAMLGFTQEEWINDPVRWYRQIHPEDKARWSLEAAQMFISGGPLKSTYRVIARDGRVVWFHCEAKIVKDNAGRSWFIHGVAFDITDLKQAEKSQREYAEQLKVLSRRLMQVQETEHRYIARELHDEIGQVLTGLKLTLEMISRLPAEQIKLSLGDAQELVNELMARVRKLSLDLRPAMLDDLGLLPALVWHINHYRSQTHIQVAFRHTGLEERRFSPEVETAAYRIVQEGLTNIARHTQVKEATVRVWADKNALGLQVEDNGKGFNADSAMATGETSGLAGMRERAVLSGGYFSIESQPSRGTRVNAEWRFDDKSQEDN